MVKDTESLTNFGFVDLALVLIFSLLILQPKVTESAINLKVGQVESLSDWGKRHTSAIKIELTSDGFIYFKGEKARIQLMILLLFKTILIIDWQNTQPIEFGCL